VEASVVAAVDIHPDHLHHLEVTALLHLEYHLEVTEPHFKSNTTVKFTKN